MPGTKDFTVYKLPATENEAKHLRIKPGDIIYKVERIRTADNVPVVYCIDRLPESIVGESLRDLSNLCLLILKVSIL